MLSAQVSEPRACEEKNKGIDGCNFDLTLLPKITLVSTFRAGVQSLL